MSTRDADLDMLRRILELTSLSEENREAFEDMRDRMLVTQHQLTEKQRAWAMQVLDEPVYENAWSAGKVPRGREVETPAALRNLPKRPPQRRSEES